MSADAPALPGPLDTRSSAHVRRLAALGRCPSCAELTGGASLLRGAACSHCGEAPGALGLAQTETVEVLTRRGRRSLAVVIGLVAVSHLLLGWLPLLEVLTLTGAAVWMRWGITLPATRAMSMRRRFVSIWTARLLAAGSVALTLIFSQLVMLLGPLALVLKAALGAGQVALAAALITAYLHRQIRREASGDPVGVGEWLLLAGSAGLLLGAVAAMGFAFFFVLRTIDWMLGGLAG